MKNNFLKIAGIINFLTALLHLIGGQIDLVHPLLNSSLSSQATAEWISVWHIVTVLLFVSSIVLLKAGFKGVDTPSVDLLRFLGWLYILISIPFIGSSLWFGVFAPQWILLLPIGILTLVSLRP